MHSLGGSPSAVVPGTSEAVDRSHTAVGRTAEAAAVRIRTAGTLSRRRRLPALAEVRSSPLLPRLDRLGMPAEVVEGLRGEEWRDHISSKGLGVLRPRAEVRETRSVSQRLTLVVVRHGDESEERVRGRAAGERKGETRRFGEIRLSRAVHASQLLFGSELACHL